MNRFILALTFFTTVVAVAQADDAEQVALRQATDQRLADTNEWRALLHMHRDALFRYRSSVDDSDFFLAEHGQTEPEQEMQSTITAFVRNETIDEQPAACRFPARYHFLSSHIRLPAAPPCERFEAWRAKLDPIGASIVFASYYMANPASMYGHTFLKLTRRAYSSTSPLLDYTVNYAAMADTRNGLIFIIKGLLGGFEGKFATDPYYVKIQKYNNMEARDLWEYDLNLDQAQVDQLLRHLWEVGPTSVSYFFFNKNCSYQLLPLLEVANANLHVSHLFRFRAIPLDTVKAVLNTPGAIRDEHIRPSHVRVMLARRSLLSKDEKSLAERLSKYPAEPIPSAMPPIRQALVLDSAFDLFRYRAGFQRIQSEKIKQIESTLLDRRQKVPAQSINVNRLASQVEPPENGQGTGRVAFGIGANRNRGFQEFDVRASLHDLEDNPTGFLPGSQLEMFHFRIRREPGEGVYLEEAKLFEILSLVPWDSWTRRPSWTVRIGAEVAHDVGRPSSSLLPTFTGGYGFSKAWGPRQEVLVYALSKGDAEVGPILTKGHRLGYAGEMGTLLRENAGARLHLTATATRFFTGDVSNRVELRAIQSVDLARNVEARLSAARINAHREAMVSLNLYW